MMKTKLSLMIAIVIMIIVAGCGEMSYKKTKTGLVYKVFPGSSKDSLAKVGNVMQGRRDEIRVDQTCPAGSRGARNLG